MPRLDRLPPHDEEGRLRAVLETPQGSRNKLRYEPTPASFGIAHVLPAGQLFPFDFGFFPRTLAADGDPLDVLVLMDAPAYPGVTVAVRLLGVIEAEQRHGRGPWIRNDRLIAVAEGATERGDLRGLADLDGRLLDQIETFFVTYDRLTGRTLRPIGRRGRRTAAKLLAEASTRS